MKEINVLSLFDGMSCGMIALERCGIKVNKYFASEIKSHAIKVSKHNYPQIIHIGDVRKVRYDNGILYTEHGVYDVDIDLLIGGSPCKGISKLNKNQEGLQHAESVLFYEYYRIYNEIKEYNNDIKFLLENTHGNKDSVNKITELMGVDKLSINSKLVSAQNRPRYYWANFCDSIPNDLGITTKDVFDYSGNKTSYSRTKWLNNDSGKKSVSHGYTKINPFPKSGCITANGYKKWNCNYLLKDGVYYDLSINEVERLQTVPENYCSVLTYEESYDVLGDGWTIDVIKHILSYLNN